MAETKKPYEIDIPDPLTIWEPGQAGRVSESFLDQLNQSGEALSGALPNPGNWSRIQGAAAQAPAKIAELEAEMGVKQPIGRIGTPVLDDFAGIDRVLKEANTPVE